MSKYVVDRKGNKHKLLTKELDFYFVMYADLFDDLISILGSYVSESTYKKLCELSIIIQDEVGHLDCDELINSVVVESGYKYEMIEE